MDWIKKFIKNCFEELAIFLINSFSAQILLENISPFISISISYNYVG